MREEAQKQKDHEIPAGPVLCSNSSTACVFRSTSGLQVLLNLQTWGRCGRYALEFSVCVCVRTIKLIRKTTLGIFIPLLKGDLTEVLAKLDDAEMNDFEMFTIHTRATFGLQEELSMKVLVRP